MSHVRHASLCQIRENFLTKIFANSDFLQRAQISALLGLLEISKSQNGTPDEGILAKFVPNLAKICGRLPPYLSQKPFTVPQKISEIRP